MDTPRPRAAAVFEHFAVEFRRTGSELRTRLCPSCGERGRDAVCVDVETGVWCDHAHGCKGDIFALLAGYAGHREVGRETFDLARLIAGEISPQPRPISATSPQPGPVDHAATWAALDRRSLVGEQYLRSRSIDPIELRAQGDILRYSPRGYPSVALRSLMNSAITGIQHRSTEGKGFHAAKGSKLAGSALCGRIEEIDRDGVDVAILVEGLCDALTARLAFAGCAVFGAPGCEQMAPIAAALAKRIVEIRGWLMIVPHDDEPGVKAAVEAVHAAQENGLVIDRDLLLVDIGEHKDLNDAWRDGWRWRWPNESGGVA